MEPKVKPVYEREIELKIGDVFLLRLVNQDSVFNWMYKSQKDTQDNIKKQITQWIGNKYGSVQSWLVGQIFNTPRMQKIFLKMFEKLTGVEYVQQMLYVGQSWVLYVEKSGSHLIKLSPNVIQDFDIYRCPKEYDEEKMFELVKKYWNIEYDKNGFWLSQVGKVMDIMKIPPQQIEYLLRQFPPQQVEGIFKYDTPNKLTSQEMIVRMYKELGIDVFDDLDQEFQIPDDIQKRFIRII